MLDSTSPRWSAHPPGLRVRGGVRHQGLNDPLDVVAACHHVRVEAVLAQGGGGDGSDRDDPGVGERPAEPPAASRKKRTVEEEVKVM